MRTYCIIADQHRQAGDLDDPFLEIEGDYVKWRNERGNKRLQVIHLGDTYDYALAYPHEVFTRWGYLNRYEALDWFLLGNHEISLDLLRAAAPGRVIDSPLNAEGYQLLHGSELFSYSDDLWENLLVAHIGYAYKHYKNRIPYLRQAYKWASEKSEHRQNVKYYPRLRKRGIKKAVFAHSHEAAHGEVLDYWNPGAFPKTHHAVFIERDRAWMEQVI